MRPPLAPSLLSCSSRAGGTLSAWQAMWSRKKDKAALRCTAPSMSCRKAIATTSPPSSSGDTLLQPRTGSFLALSFSHSCLLSKGGGDGHTIHRKQEGDARKMAQSTECVSRKQETLSSTPLCKHREAGFGILALGRRGQEP